MFVLNILTSYFFLLVASFVDSRIRLQDHQNNHRQRAKTQIVLDSSSWPKTIWQVILCLETSQGHTCMYEHVYITYKMTTTFNRCHITAGSSPVTVFMFLFTICQTTNNLFWKGLIVNKSTCVNVEEKLDEDSLMLDKQKQISSKQKQSMLIWL